MQTEYLSWAEKNKISNQKDVYVILRSIMFLKMCRGADRIDDQTFKQQVAKLKKKYQLFTSMIPNFDIKKFCEQFNIPQQEIQGATVQLQRSSSDKDQKLNGYQLWMSITAIFIQVGDFCSLNVGQIKSLGVKLFDRLNWICLQFMNNQLNQKVKRLQKMFDDFIGSKTVDEQLTEVQVKEIKVQVQLLYEFLFELSGMPKSQKKNH